MGAFEDVEGYGGADQGEEEVRGIAQHGYQMSSTIPASDRGLFTLAGLSPGLNRMLPESPTDLFL